MISQPTEIWLSAVAATILGLAPLALAGSSIILDPDDFEGYPRTVISASPISFHTVTTNETPFWMNVGPGVIDEDGTGAAVFAFTEDLIVPNTVVVRVTGPKPLAILVGGDLILRGTLDVSGCPGDARVAGEGGPGGGRGGNGGDFDSDTPAEPGTGTGRNGRGGGTNGGGGGFGGQGERSTSTTNTYSPGVPENNLKSFSVTRILAGSGGAGAFGEEEGVEGVVCKLSSKGSWTCVTEKSLLEGGKVGPEPQTLRISSAGIGSQQC